MGGVTGESNGNLVKNNTTKENLTGQPSQEVTYGELLWVKLREASWWPAQVVDENSVSSANKPRSKKSTSHVLVRLYGSYTYKYADVHKSRAEFRNVLIDNNFNYDDIMKKSLELDLPSLNSNKSKRRQQSNSKGKVRNKSPEKDITNKSQSKSSSKKRKQEKVKTDETHPQTPQGKTKNQNLTRDTEPSTPDNVASRPEEFSARRMKVMQILGLVAPSGSPFPRNRVVSPA